MFSFPGSSPHNNNWCTVTSQSDVSDCVCLCTHVSSACPWGREKTAMTQRPGGTESTSPSQCTRTTREAAPRYRKVDSGRCTRPRPTAGSHPEQQERWCNGRTENGESRNPTTGSIKTTKNTKKVKDKQKNKGQGQQTGQ